MNSTDTFSTRLSNLMYAQGLTYGKLAELSNVSKSNIGRYASSADSGPISYPTLDTARKLADALGVSLDYLSCIPSKIEANDIKAYASEMIGLTERAVSTINKLAKSTYDPIVERVFDPWRIAEMVNSENSQLSPNLHYLDECFFSGPAARDILNSFFCPDNYLILSNMLDLIREYTAITVLEKRLENDIKGEKRYLESHPECGREYSKELEESYRRKLNKQRRTTHTEIIYQIMTLIDKIADSYTETDAESNSYAEAVAAIHNLVESTCSD